MTHLSFTSPVFLQLHVPYATCPLQHLSLTPPVLYTTCPALLISYPVLYTTCPALLISYPVLYTTCPALLISYPLLCTTCPALLISYPVLCTTCPALPAQATDPDLEDMEPLAASLAQGKAQAPPPPHTPLMVGAGRPSTASAPRTSDGAGPGADGGSGSGGAGGVGSGGVGGAGGGDVLCKGSFLVLLLIKVLCEDKLLAAMQRYVALHLGTQVRGVGEMGA